MDETQTYQFQAYDILQIQLEEGNSYRRGIQGWTDYATLKTLEEGNIAEMIVRTRGQVLGHVHPTAEYRIVRGGRKHVVRIRD